MLDFLKAFVKSRAFKEILAVVAAALAGYASSGCAGAQKTPQLAVFECRAAVLAPYVADAAPDIVAAIHAGDVNPVALLMSLGLSLNDIKDIAKRYAECAPPPPAPPADAGVIQG